MKQIIIILALLLLCGTASAAYYLDKETGYWMPLPKAEDSDHFIIHVLIWDNNTQPEEGVNVTFANRFTYQTASDGSVSFDTANLANNGQRIDNGRGVSVSSKYGSKLVIVTYKDGHTGLTFNEPSESVVIEAFAAMGFAVVIALGGGRYILRRKKKIIKQEDTMTEDNKEWKLKRDFGVRALIATLSITGYILTTAIAVYQNNTDMIDSIVNWYMPLLMAIVAFYFAGSIAKQSQQ